MTAEYFDIYGRDVKKDAAALRGDNMGGGSMSGGGSPRDEPDDGMEINGP
jgi:hypothetical protein